MSKRLQGHRTTSNEKTEFTAQDENGLSCAVEAVGRASGSVLIWYLHVNKDYLGLSTSQYYIILTNGKVISYNHQQKSLKRTGFDLSALQSQQK